MGKICKVVVCGSAGVGKTAVLEQVIYGTHRIGQETTCPTIEDIYVANIETNRGTRERVRFYDTRGLTSSNQDLPKHYLSMADGFLMVYSTTSQESFNMLEYIKKEIDKLKDKDKKEISVVMIGNKVDLNQQRQVDFRTASDWAVKEKIQFFEVTVANRSSLIQPIVSLTSKLTIPPTKSTFSISVRNFKPKQLQSFGDS
ncbi:NF-kappa-B inhibitor-interacting Ras-like protein 2 [Lytechinus variegatus]|uniref:NF-kappa-B inhibitor-interacting Ras-like protein 2 n=1 Tax=Lytechinus variegatus TaxID=7654 RepID=UPI001BB21C91|nr:NF-kappa-B inhibitor-interacting Ras-like protein 2 [Lytechinus variegatus]XP_041452779.1 NF-kappa-B inhibitor-interacting Ras-like protein 2 [Lytechinus variegatus]XP_041452780.1 NF-kappa-B inhibitor-interacting Ras-like protein 2 [Lytechinus variegatus]